MQGKKNYQEKLFTNFRLSERVPDDNFYRRLNDVLDLQWLYKATGKYYGKEGQKSIDPVVFFKLILIGYLENLCSDRRIISTVSMRLDMLYFIGYDIDEELPWHSTLSRTRQLYSEDVFKELFKQVLRKCIEKGMVAGRRQSIDSAFVKANASLDSLVEREILEDAVMYADTLNLVNEDGEIILPVKKLKSKNDKFRSKTDGDARMSTKPGKPTQLNYRAQVSVDAASHVITNIEAHYADKSDNECLPEVVHNTTMNLLSSGLIVEEVIADTGYSCGKALKYLENNNLTGYIPNPSGYKAEREGFTYDRQNDQYICSQGTILPFKAIVRTEMDTYKKEYRSSRKDCYGCPLRYQCGATSGHKKIVDSVDKAIYDRMNERMLSSKAKRMMQLRKSTVEPVIGTLVCYLGMKKVNTRGINQANKCVMMAGLAYNLKKILKHKGPTVNVVAKALVEGLKKAEKVILCFYVALQHLLQPHLHVWKNHKIRLS
jgi:transposase